MTTQFDPRPLHRAEIPPSALEAAMDDPAFARLFAAQYADFTEDLGLWIALAREYPGPVLEIGCGDGRVLVALAREGFQVTGVDHNGEMLRLARRRLPEELRLRVRLERQDARALDLGELFALIVAPCNTLALMEDHEFAQALNQVRRHLRPGGGFAFENPNPDEALEDLAGGDEPLAAFIEPQSGNPVQVYARQRADLVGRSVAVDWRYDELLPDGLTRSWSLHSTYHLRSTDELARRLADAGFTRAAFYGGYRRQPLDEHSDRLIVVAGT